MLECSAACERMSWWIVGTAVYHEGRNAPSHPKKPAASNLGGADHRCTRSQRRERRCDQSVNVVQRHDVQTAVVGGQSKRRGDRARGRADIRVREGHQLWPRGSAGGVQNQCDIVGMRKPAIEALRLRRAGEREDPGFSRRLRGQRDDRNPTPLGRDARGRAHSGLNDQRLDTEIREVRVELADPVAGIQRRAGGRGGDGDERRGHVGGARHDERHAIAPPHAERVQGAGHVSDMIIQTAVG